tara:strand:- start:4 stop:1509 length:1506 start_codon:yes stop_codon:yes gene_type:complete
MASSFTTNFGFEEMATGDQSGTWGDTTNFNFDILDRIAAYKAVALSDGATATLTVREASPGSGTENLQDGMFRVIKFTGSLSQNCTITIAPNTTTAWFIFENATTDAGSSGPYSLIFSQGSGANITLQNGKNVAVYCDGAGSGAAVANALSDLQIATLEVTGAAAIDGAATLGGALSVATTSTLTGAATASAGITAAKEDSGTNTVLNTITVKRTSSGSPAAGIGAGIEFTTETAAANNEIGSVIQSVTTDVTGGAEIFDIVFKNMTAGSAAAEVARMSGAGVFSAEGGVTAKKEDSGTNTVIDPLVIQRTSSATPAAGIGAGLAYVVETAAGNNETGATIDAVTTDVSSTSEDFDLTFNLMAAGAAAAEKMRLESTGYLGIGVTNPSVQLHIAKSAVADIGTLTSATSITPDFATSQNFTVTLAHNAALENPSNVVAGQTGSIFVVQDGTGSRTMSYGTNWEFPGGTAPTLTTTAAALDRIDYVVRSATSIQAVATLAYA